MKRGGNRKSWKRSGRKKRRRIKKAPPISNFQKEQEESVKQLSDLAFKENII